MAIVIRARYGSSNVAGSHGPIRSVPSQWTTTLQLVGDLIGVVKVQSLNVVPQDEGRGEVEQSFNAAAVRCGAVHNGLQSASDFEASFQRAVAVLAPRAPGSWWQ